MIQVYNVKDLSSTKEATVSQPQDKLGACSQVVFGKPFPSEFETEGKCPCDGLHLVCLQMIRLCGEGHLFPDKSFSLTMCHFECICHTHDTRKMT